MTALLKQFGLTTAAEELVPRLTQAGHHDALPVLLEVFEAEAEARRQRRIARLRRARTSATRQDVRDARHRTVAGAGGAATGDAGHRDVPPETATNVLAFSLPGVDKSHAQCAVGHALVEAGHSVLCAPAYALVQELLGNVISTCPAPSASSTRTPRGRDRIRRAELPHGPLPPKIAAVTCAPRPCSRSAAALGPPTVDLVNARTGPGFRAACGSRQRRGKRARAVVPGCCRRDGAFPPPLWTAQAPPTRPTGIIVVDDDPRRPEPARIVDPKRALPRLICYRASIVASEFLLPKGGTMSTISPQARQELVTAVAERYQRSTPAERGRILDEFVALTG